MDTRARDDSLRVSAGPTHVSERARESVGVGMRCVCWRRSPRGVRGPGEVPVQGPAIGESARRQEGVVPLRAVELDALDVIRIRPGPWSNLVALLAVTEAYIDRVEHRATSGDRL